jgi:hypothetical protein
MVRVVRHRGPTDFLQRAEPWLLAAEDRNNLILGLAYGLAARDADGSDVFYATVERDDLVVGCALRTPPYKLLVTDAPPEACEPLAEALSSAYDVIPAVLGPERLAEAVAMAWVARRGGGWRPGMEQRVYRLDEVTPASGVPGSLREANSGDVDLAVEWGAGFARDTGLRFAATRESIGGWVEKRQLFLWEDDEPRSIAVAHGRTPKGARVGYVYTPPESRGRGYASACVGALSQELLDRGVEFCVLYTDLSNRTSNAIYTRLGYYPIDDVRDVDLVPEQVSG